MGARAILAVLVCARVSLPMQSSGVLTASVAAVLAAVVVVVAVV